MTKPLVLIIKYVIDTAHEGKAIFCESVGTGLTCEAIIIVSLGGQI